MLIITKTWWKRLEIFCHTNDTIFQRPIISNGDKLAGKLERRQVANNIDSICKIATRTPVKMIVDSCRCFDYLPNAYTHNLFGQSLLQLTIYDITSKNQFIIWQSDSQDIRWEMLILFSLVKVNLLRVPGIKR